MTELAFKTDPSDALAATTPISHTLVETVMDPLMIARAFGKLVDAVLVDGRPFRHAELLPGHRP